MTGRLPYEPVQPADLDAFHGLVQDEHVRRYMGPRHRDLAWAVAKEQRYTSGP